MLFGIGNWKCKDCSGRTLKIVALYETVRMLPTLIGHAWIKLQTVYLKFHNALMDAKLQEMRRDY